MTEARTKARFPKPHFPKPHFPKPHFPKPRFPKVHFPKARFPEYTADDTRRIGIAGALVLAVVTALGLHTLISAPAIREATQAELARIIADEDRDVCGRFGLSPGTSAFAACSRELANVRQRQSDRDQAAAAGLL